MDIKGYNIKDHYITVPMKLIPCKVNRKSQQNKNQKYFPVKICFQNSKTTLLILISADRSRPSSYEPDDYYAISSWPSQGITWWQILLVTLLMVVVIILIVKACLQMYQHGLGFAKVTCYLCMEKVNKGAWTSGQHRRQCATK
jgi:hypothetical protein